jgi:hypothetical protein
MLAAVGRFAVRWRRWVLAGTLLAVVVAGALGGGVFDRLSGGGFSDPDAESSRARDQLERVFGAGDPNLVLLVTAKRGSVDDPATAAVGAALTRQLVVGGPYRYVRNPVYLAAPRPSSARRWRSASRGCWGTPRPWAAPWPPSPTATRSRHCAAGSAPSTRPTGRRCPPSGHAATPGNPARPTNPPATRGDRGHG